LAGARLSETGMSATTLFLASRYEEKSINPLVELALGDSLNKSGNDVATGFCFLKQLSTIHHLGGHGGKYGG